LIVAAPEAFAGRRQHDNRDHAPQNAEHGQKAAELVRAQVLDGLEDGFTHYEGSTTLSPRLRPSRISTFAPLPTPIFTGTFFFPFFVPGARRSTKAFFLAS